MVSKLKAPVAIVTIVAAALTVLGSLIGWFDIGNPLASSLAEGEFQDRQNIAIVIALIVAGVTAVAAVTGKKLLAVISILVGAFAALMVFNQLPNADEKELLDITTSIGYWLTLVGTLGMVVGSLGIVVKGFTRSE